MVMCRLVGEPTTVPSTRWTYSSAATLASVIEVMSSPAPVEILAALDVEEGPPPPALEPSELRVDEAQPSLPVDDALANAPEGHDDFVAVPKVLAPKEKGGVE